MSIKQRLEKLERVASPARGYSIALYEGETHEQAIAAAGIRPNEADRVVFVCRGAALEIGKPRLFGTW